MPEFIYYLNIGSFTHFKLLFEKSVCKVMLKCGYETRGPVHRVFD